MRIQVKISFKYKNIANVSFVESELPPLSNVANISSLTGATGSGYKGLQVSLDYDKKLSTLDGEYGLFSVSGYPGIITREVTDEHGVCDISIPFYLNGNKPDDLYISFDNITKEYATDFTISANARTIAITGNTSTLLIIPLEQLQLPDVLADVKFIINITKWSHPNASIKLTCLSSYYIQTYTGRDLKTVIASENLLNAQMNITPGICEQYANITVYDRDGVLRKFAQLNKLSKDFIASISAIDDSTGDVYDFGNYIIADWDFDSTSSTVGISCRDKSYLFEKINIKRAPVADRSLDELLGELFGQAKDMSWKYQDQDTRERCESIKIPNSWYYASDLYTLLNKVCSLGMLRIYWYIDTFVVGRSC